MKINKQNIHTVFYRLNNALNNKNFTNQRFYHQAKRRNSLRKHYNLPDEDYLSCYEVEESALSIWSNKNTFELETNFITRTPDEPFIRVIDDMNRGFLINAGDEIKFNQNRITIRTWHPTKKEKCTMLITY